MTLYPDKCQHNTLTDDSQHSTLINNNPIPWQMTTLYPENLQLTLYPYSWQHYSMRDDKSYTWQMTALYCDRGQPYTLTDVNPNLLINSNHIARQMTSLSPENDNKTDNLTNENSIPWYSKPYTLIDDNQPFTLSDDNQLYTLTDENPKLWL